MEKVTLYKVVSEEVFVADGQQYFQQHHYEHPPAPQILGTDSFVIGCTEVENIIIEEFRNNSEGVRNTFLFGCDRDTKNLLLKVREPEITEEVKSLRGEVKSLQRKNGSLQTHLDYANKNDQKVSEAGFWQRLKWVFTGVKSSDVIAETLTDLKAN